MRSDNYKTKKEVKHCEYIGRFVTLSAKRFNEHGVYLGKDNFQDDILLPGKEQPDGLKRGDELKVFVYRDSDDRPIATTKTPLITMEHPALLEVAEMTHIGAFLDWGLEKQLLLPFHEMTTRIERGDEVFVKLYIDKSERLCATQKHIYDILSTKSPYSIGDEASGRIYQFSKDFGTFLAIDDKYSAMISRSEDTKDLKIGDVIQVHVTGVKEDGKLDVSRRNKAHKQIKPDSELIMEVIESYGGTLPFSDKASPERIMEEFGISKAAFKRAVGNLYKKRLIIIKEDSISIC